MESSLISFAVYGTYPMGGRGRVKTAAEVRLSCLRVCSLDYITHTLANPSNALLSQLLAGEVMSKVLVV